MSLHFITCDMCESWGQDYGVVRIRGERRDIVYYPTDRIAASVAGRDRCCYRLYRASTYLSSNAAELTLRLIASEGRILLDNLIHRTLTDEEWTRLARVTRWIRDAPLVLDDYSGATLAYDIVRGDRMLSPSSSKTAGVTSRCRPSSDTWPRRPFVPR